MANTSSAKKMVRKIVRRTSINKARRSRMRGLVRKVEEAISSGDKVRGTTIAELGNRNQPLDMITYRQNDQDYLLLANSARGVMKISTDDINRAQGIEERVGGGGTAGQEYETIADWQGVVQLDRLNDTQAVVLVQGDSSADLKTLPLP